VRFSKCQFPDLVDNNGEEERVLPQGIRQLRSDTNWRYRDSALTMFLMDVLSLRDRLKFMEDLIVLIASTIVFFVITGRNAFKHGHFIL
jgi:hypothetical protein